MKERSRVLGRAAGGHGRSFIPQAGQKFYFE
jgi:hypothetical protein